MKKTTTLSNSVPGALLLVLLLLAPVWAGPAEDLFSQGNAKFTARDYKGALDLYEQALKLEPNSSPLLFKAGAAAEMQGDKNKAVLYLEQAHKIDPTNWQGAERLILVCEAVDKYAEAEIVSQDLIKLWQSHADADFSKTPFFRRDRLSHAGVHYLVLQMFAPDPDKKEPLYDFVQMGADEKPVREYLLYFDKSMSDAATAKAHKPVEAWVLMLREAPNHVVMFGTVDRRLTYVQAVQAMTKIWSGEIKPVRDNQKPAGRDPGPPPSQ